MDLRDIRFLSAFCPFFLLHEKSIQYVLFYFYIFITAPNRIEHTGQKFSTKNFFVGVQLDFEISLSSFIHKMFEQIF